MDISVIQPSARLTPYVKYYWTLEAENADHREFVYPVAGIQFFFHYKNPFIQKSAKGNHIQPAAFIQGQVTSSSIVHSCGSCGMISVVLHDHSARAFIPFSLDEITDSRIPVEDVYAGSRFISEMLGECSNTHERVAVVERFLLARLNVENACHLFFVKRCSELVRDVNARLTVESIGTALNISERQFERIFRSHIGISPKRYIDLARFNFAVELLRSTSNLTNVAHESGYYDQAHFIREFKKFTGVAPGVFKSWLDRKNFSDNDGFIQSA